MYKFLFTGGGTAGHVTPNIAIIDLLKSRYPDAEFHYIGSLEGIEKEIIAGKPFVKYYGVHTGKLRRYFSLKTVKDLFNVPKGRREAVKLIKEIRPDVLFSKGGYVAVPVVAAAKKCGVPALCHESDITPGLANKISLRYADKICVTFPDTVKNLPEGKGIFTGTPIRAELYRGNAEKARAELGFDGKPVILVMGGSIGSSAINAAIRENIVSLTESYNIIHLCGKGKLSEEPALLANPSYRQFEFVSEPLPDYIALSDMIISRAGANAIHEFLALKKPMLLIPLPAKASRGDQLLNAESFRSRGLAHVLAEESITPGTLLAAVRDLDASRAGLIDAMSAAANIDGTLAIVSLIEGYLTK